MKSGQPQFGIIGGGSWATALAKILTDKKQAIRWYVRSIDARNSLQQTGRNPQYLKDVLFDTGLLHLSDNIQQVVAGSEILVIAVPSAFIRDTLRPLTAKDWENKKAISAVKGILPEMNILLNYYMQQAFGLSLENYFAILGPCHAEEVAAGKLSYLTISGTDIKTASQIASHFTTPYINTIINHDILGVQYAAVLKNIYALGAGIAAGLGYGDNFLSVFIANAADEMAGFLKKFGAEHITVGEHEGEDPYTHRKTTNYAASVYLGDLLVTCYSTYSRNRNFGKMIGEGLAVEDSMQKMNMVAEGYNASRCIYSINKRVEATVPIAETVYRILWEKVNPAEGFKRIEEVLV
jgi:glycerol-3-phosphate dehydrogenase (NAD(P)+)